MIYTKRLTINIYVWVASREYIPHATKAVRSTHKNDEVIYDPTISIDVLVLFGSSSDSYVYEPLCELLQGNGLKVDFEIISAHRNPDRLEERLSLQDYACVIAGAGISAHLPGVVASKVQVPVYGIPC